MLGVNAPQKFIRERSVSEPGNAKSDREAEREDSGRKCTRAFTRR